MPIVNSCTKLQNYEDNIYQKIGKILDEYHNMNYDTFEEFKKDFWEKIDSALKDVAEGRVIPMEIAVQKMREKYVSKIFL